MNGQTISDLEKIVRNSIDNNYRTVWQFNIMKARHQYELLALETTITQLKIMNIQDTDKEYMELIKNDPNMVKLYEIAYKNPDIYNTNKEYMQNIDIRYI